MVIIVLGLIYFESTRPGNKFNQKNNAVEKSKEIVIKAFKYGYDPDVVTISKGDNIKLIINNVDVPHGIRIPALNLKGEEEIEFTANTAGEYEWYCLIPCGSGHMQMKGKLVVK